MDSVLPTPIFARKNIVFASATLCCLLWGSSYPAIKSGYELFQIATNDISSKVVFAGYRFVFAGLLLLLLALAQRKPIGRLSPRQFGQLTVLGLTQTAIQYTFFYIGLAYTTGAKGSIMNATATFFSVMLAHFIYQNDKISYNKALGCILGFAGVMIVNFNSGLQDFHFVWNGDGFVVLAAFILSAATLYGKRISQTVDPMVMTGWQLAIGGVMLVVGGYITGGNAGSTQRQSGGHPRLSDPALLGGVCAVEFAAEVQPRQYDCTLQLLSAGGWNRPLCDFPRGEYP